MPIQPTLSPRLISNIASLYTNVNRIFLEYIDNALDSAEEYYSIEDNSYSRKIEIRFEVIGSTFRNGSIAISDNCKGMEDLSQVVHIGNSEKKAQPFLNGEFGFGIYAFMSACKTLHITSKYEDKSAFRIEIDKIKFDEDEINNVLFPDLEKCKYDYESGTMAVLKGFNKETWKSIEVQKLQEEIESHFELLLKRKNISIIFIKKGVPNICSAYNYDDIPGIEFSKEITSLKGRLRGDEYNYHVTDQGKPPIKIYLKLSDNISLNRPPVFIKSGRRINQISKISNFKSKHKSDIWKHPKLTGFIDVGNFLSPTLNRVDFKNNQQTRSFYNSLFDLENEILEWIEMVNEDQDRKHYQFFEDKLNSVLSGLAKLDMMNYRTDLIAGNELPLDSGGGGHQFTEEGTGAKDRGSDIPNEGEGFSFGLNEGEGLGIGENTNENNIPGNEEGEGLLNQEPEFLDENPELTGRRRKKSGFNIKILHRDISEDADGNLLRSELVGDSIEIYAQHDDFKDRVKKRNTGEKVITPRLITYIAGEITVHYKDKFWEKTQQDPEYDKKQLVELVGFIYQFENLLQGLSGQNLANVSE